MSSASDPSLAGQDVARSIGFALVDSLLMMSARSVTSAEEFSTAARGRLRPLNKAHELVRPGLSATEIAEPCAVPLKRVIADILQPESTMLANKDDPHSIKVFDPSIMANAIALS